MGSIRQGKIESVIQTELASFFQKNNSICLGSYGYRDRGEGYK